MKFVLFLFVAASRRFFVPKTNNTRALVAGAVGAAGAAWLSRRFHISPPRGGAEIQGSVVKLFVTKQRAGHVDPWQAQSVEAITGSGAIIRMPGGGVGVLTAAHVVADALLIQVRSGLNNLFI